mgnify:CR=1 FL=1
MVPQATHSFKPDKVCTNEPSFKLLASFSTNCCSKMDAAEHDLGYAKSLDVFAIQINVHSLVSLKESFAFPDESRNDKLDDCSVTSRKAEKDHGPCKSCCSV